MPPDVPPHSCPTAVTKRPLNIFSSGKNISQAAIGVCLLVFLGSVTLTLFSICWRANKLCFKQGEVLALLLKRAPCGETNSEQTRKVWLILIWKALLFSVSHTDLFQLGVCIDTCTLCFSCHSTAAVHQGTLIYLAMTVVTHSSSFGAAADDHVLLQGGRDPSLKSKESTHQVPRDSSRAKQPPSSSLSAANLGTDGWLRYRLSHERLTHSGSRRKWNM